MATIQVTPETLREKATEIRTLKSEHDEVMNKMTNLIHALNEQWKGEAQTAFVSKYDSMQSTFTNFSEMLDGYAKLIDASANELEMTDQNLKNKIVSF